MVTRDGGIPLTWHAYPGDRPGATQFPDMIDQLKTQYEEACAAAGLPASKHSLVDKDRFGGLTAFDTRREVYGAGRRAILTHSPELHATQAAGFTDRRDRPALPGRPRPAQSPPPAHRNQPPHHS
ncbi:MAG: hypothetical protein ABSB76_29630 [Streptosporangiaceae bacterium]